MSNTTGNTSTGDNNIDALIAKERWASNTVTFSFTDSFSNDYESDYRNYQDSKNDKEEIIKGHSKSFQALDSTQKDVVQQWMHMYENVSGLNLVELTGTEDKNATMRIAESHNPQTAYAYLPSTSVEGGDIWFNRSDYNTPTIGNYAYHTFGHEIGHALGLEHGHETGGISGVSMNSDRDSMEFSIMTYRSYENAPTDRYRNEDWGYAQSLMMFDIRATQQMYGANFNYNADNTVYTFSTDTGEMFVNGVGQGTPGDNRIFRTIWDGNGIDTYDFSNYTTNLLIDLSPGGWSDLAVGENFQRANLGDGNFSRGHVFNALQFDGDNRSLIENVLNSQGNDTIIANEVANIFGGYEKGTKWGNDTIQEANRQDALDLTSYQRHEVQVVQNGNDAEIKLLGGNDGVITVEDYYKPGNESLKLWYRGGLTYQSGYESKFKNSPYPLTKNDRMEVGDFNGDGKDELLTFTSHYSGKEVAYDVQRNAQGVYAYQGGYETKFQNSPYPLTKNDRMEVGDFNGDGADELLVFTSHYSGKEVAYDVQRNAQGVYAYQGGYETKFQNSPYPLTKNDRVEVGDFNGDGTDELLVFTSHYSGKEVAYDVQRNAQGVYAYQGGYETKFQNSPYPLTKNDRMEVGDFNGDGADELLVFTSHYSGKEVAYDVQRNAQGVYAYQGGYETKFQNSPYPLTKNDRVEVGDFNGDGADELLVFTSHYSGKEIAYHVQRNAQGVYAYQGGYESKFQNSPYALTKNDRVEVEDFDGDGVDELLVFTSHHTGKEIAYQVDLTATGFAYQGGYEENFKASPYALGASDRVLTGDFSGDGSTELLMSTTLDNGVINAYEVDFVV